jgi:tRNA (guanine-N7-)-methyltransferase
MGQKKLMRFEELKTFSNVFQFEKAMKGSWKKFFNNDHAITLELACGKGEYTVGLARLYPSRNFIGVDIKGNRLWVGAKKALKDSLHNVAFLRTEIDQLAEYFNENDIAEIWITFPDPHLRFSKGKKRLTHPKFLRLYQKILSPGGIIHLKTDSPHLYHFTKRVIEYCHCVLHRDDENVYAKENVTAELMIKTHYEGIDIANSNRVHYLSFSLPPELPGTESDKIFKEKLKEDEWVG